VLGHVGREGGGRAEGRHGGRHVAGLGEVDGRGRVVGHGIVDAVRRRAAGEKAHQGRQRLPAHWINLSLKKWSQNIRHKICCLAAWVSRTAR